MAAVWPRLLLILIFAPSLAVAGEHPQEPQSTGTRQQFEQQLQEFRELVIEMRRLQLEYIHAPTYDDAIPLRARYDELVERGNAELDKLIPLGEHWFAEQTAGGGTADNQLAYFMTKVMVRHFDQCRYEQAYQLAKKLIVNNKENIGAPIYMARAGLLTNRFDSEISAAISAHSEFFSEKGNISLAEQAIIANGNTLQDDFQREMEIRQAEQLADDLPRVRFETSRGEFVIELFENEAPETVANFITLVEQRHYDGMSFNVVIDKTAAETGDVTADGEKREIGYTIRDEFAAENARTIFAGSVVMVSEKPNSGGARFFVALAALPNLGGQRTVFGRVISGMEAVYLLNKTFKIEEQEQIEIEDVVPDRVISAAVIRKRKHDYLPNKIPTKKR